MIHYLRNNTLRVHLVTILVVFMAFVTLPSHAQSASGSVQEVKMCGADNKSGTRWARVFTFKVDGQWFGIWQDHYGAVPDYDNNSSLSLVMMAFSQGLTVKVKATDKWHSHFEKCAQSGAIFHDNPGDYIHILH